MGIVIRNELKNYVKDVQYHNERMIHLQFGGREQLCTITHNNQIRLIGSYGKGETIIDSTEGENMIAR